MTVIMLSVAQRVRCARRVRGDDACDIAGRDSQTMRHDSLRNETDGHRRDGALICKRCGSDDIHNRAARVSESRRVPASQTTAREICLTDCRRHFAEQILTQIPPGARTIRIPAPRVICCAFADPRTAIAIRVVDADAYSSLQHTHTHTQANYVDTR